MPDLKMHHLALLCFFSSCVKSFKMLINQGSKLFIRNKSIGQKLPPLLFGLTRNSTTSLWNYEEEKKNFKLTAPRKYNFARDVIDKWADREKVFF